LRRRKKGRKITGKRSGSLSIGKKSEKVKPESVEGGRGGKRCFRIGENNGKRKKLWFQNDRDNLGVRRGKESIHRGEGDPYLKKTEFLKHLGGREKV